MDTLEHLMEKPDVEGRAPLGAVEEVFDEGPVVRYGADERLHVVTEGGMVPVSVRLCFPWSEPRRLLSLRDDDEEEVALVEDPALLDAASREAVERALAEAGFVLEVTRVLEIVEEVEIRHWIVETRQGRRAFQTHLDAWPRALRGGGLLVRDVAGDLYRLSNPEELDRRSRELLWAFVD
jgi:hypothetical protein